MELFKLIGTIAIDNSEAKKKLQETGEEGKKAEGKLSKLASGAAKAGQVIATGIAAGAVAVATLGGFAINAYAEYEQLAGGAKLLFGDAYGYIEEQAKNAYKTVQMSTNDYLQQVNGFSTGLKTALGGNEQAAAELAHKIVVAEADIVAATGNSAENVQNAFNGIMKSNFTMLDNLQLGITPTKEGFQEVINKVNEWNKANGEATKYQIDNLADCQSALIDYIEMQGLSGYATKEASGTIQGSLEMTKGAWDNLLVGLASGNADIPQLVSNVVSSGTQVIQNIIPVAKNVLKSLPAAISEISPEAGAAFQSIVDGVMAILPTLKETLTTTFNVVCDVINFMNEHQGLMIGIATAVGTVVTALGLYNAVQAIKTALDITGTLTLGSLTTAIWANVAATAAMLAPYLAVVAAVGAVIAIGVLLYKNWDEIKAKCLELAQNIKQKFNEMKEAVVNKVSELKDKAVQKFNDVKDSIVKVCTNVVNWVKDNWKSILTFFINPFAGLFTYFYENNSKFREFVDNAINAIKQLPSKAWTWLRNTISKVASFVSDLANKGKQAGSKLLTNVVNGVKNLPSKMLSIGKDVVQGIWKGITNAKDWLLNKIKGFAKTITKGIKDFFGIKSPSTVMRDEVGKMLAEGVAVGITANTEKVEKASDKMAQNVLEAAQKRLDDYKVYNNLTLADEVGYWDAVRVQIAEGTEARIEADKKYLEAKKTLNTELTNAESELQKSLDAIYQKIEDKAKSLLGTFKLFEEFAPDEAISEKDMFSGLTTQIQAMNEYSKQLAILKARIGDSALFEEVSAMGVGALKQVKTLAQMDEWNLKMYVEMYNTRYNLARKTANIELKDEVIAETQQAYQTFSDKCAELGVEVSTNTETMKTSINTAFTAIEQTVTTVTTSIVGNIGEKMQNAVDTVTTALETMKNAFENFQPKMKMPHFNIDGVFDIATGSVPTISVEWYKKAMDSPMLLDRPTIFGYSASSGNLLGGGEAGTEIVAGSETLMGMIKNAVSSQNAELISVLAQILKAIVSMDSNMGDNLKEALEDMGLKLNNREFARIVKAVN